MKASKLPSGSWRVLVPWRDDSGTRHMKSFTAKTARQAERAAMEFALRRQNLTEDSFQTVQDALESFLSSNDAVLSPSTKKAYRSLQRTAFDSIANLQLNALTNGILQRWISGYAINHAPKTVRNAWGLLGSVLSAYCPGVTFNVNLPQKNAQDFRIPQKAEVDAILKEADGTTMFLPILLAAHCGLRRSEIMALTWDSVDMNKRIIHVREALVNGEDGFVRKGPKTAAGKRDMDMTDAIYDFLLEADRELPLIQVSPQKFTKRFRTICRRLGLEDYHPHLLRHFYASTLCALNIPEAYAVKLMGHSSADMIRKVYGHVLDDPEMAFRETIVKHFSQNGV